MGIKIDIKPLSVNRCWQGRRFKTKEYKEYERKLLHLLPGIDLPQPPYEVEIEVGYSNKSNDIDNFLKPFNDILQKRYNFNDKEIYRLIINKTIVKKGEEFIFFNIRAYL